jgi:multidrug efflux system membrane fusion protein
MRKWLVFLCLVVVATLLGWGLYVVTGEPGALAQTQKSGPPPVPVTAGTAAAKDMPVYVRGIGSVQAFNTVAVKSRADGQIVKVDFTEGQEVKAGDLLFEIDPRPYQAALAQAVAAQQKDQAQLVSVLADLKRDEELVKHSYQTEQAYDQQKALVGQVEASIKVDQAMIDTAKLNLDYTNIRSPIDGRTGARLVDVGNLVHATDNTSLVTITQLRPIFVSFTAPQNQFDTIRSSQARTAVPVQALTPDDKKVLATGKVTLLDNQIDQASGTIHIKAQFANQDAALWPGEFVNLRLVVDELKNAVTVPQRAVEQGPDGPYLFVIKPDMTVEIRDVQVAETEDGLAVITKGLAAGDEIVVDGQYRLDGGTRVSLQPPPSAQSGAPAAPPSE